RSTPRRPRSTPFPYTTLFRSPPVRGRTVHSCTSVLPPPATDYRYGQTYSYSWFRVRPNAPTSVHLGTRSAKDSETSHQQISGDRDRKSTRLNSSHVKISYAVF